MAARVKVPEGEVWDDVAKKRGQTVSELIREAVRLIVARELTREPALARELTRKRRNRRSGSDEATAASA
jgi:hypothetical protein